MEPKYYRGWHLAKSDFEYRVTGFEWSVLRFSESFARFVAETGSVIFTSDLKMSEHIILHIIRMQDRPKNGATIARLMNRDDLPNIQYCLRKLESAGLVQKIREGKGNQFAYAVTEKGEKVTDEYHGIKAQILMNRLMQIQDVPEKLEMLTNFLSILTGVYEEAARDSATITSNELPPS